MRSVWKSLVGADARDWCRVQTLMWGWCGGQRLVYRSEVGVDVKGWCIGQRLVWRSKFGV